MTKALSPPNDGEFPQPVRDCNEASATQLTQTVDLMAETVKIPILVDGDSGFGNHNNFSMLVRGLEKAGAAGVVIEDKVYPKLNSFAPGYQELASIDEMVGKIKAGLNARRNHEFSIIARTEAFILGRSQDEALERALAFYEAGADAIFIHSKKKDGDEIFEFLRRWNHRSPVAIAPTTYFETPPQALSAAGASFYICANQSLRASVRAMAEVCAKIFKDRGIAGVENRVSPLSEIFDLLDYQSLERLERIYLPRRRI